jgi:hypothetical protein
LYVSSSMVSNWKQWFYDEAALYFSFFCAGWIHADAELLVTAFLFFCGLRWRFNDLMLAIWPPTSILACRPNPATWTCSRGLSAFLPDFTEPSDTVRQPFKKKSDTVRRRRRRLADWVLPFFGRAEYIPELSLWLASRTPTLSPGYVLWTSRPWKPHARRFRGILWTLEYLDLPGDEGWSPT